MPSVRLVIVNSLSFHSFEKIVYSSGPDVTYQDVQAIRAQETDKYGAHGSDEQSGVVEGIGHGQNPGSQTAFEQVDESLGIPTSDDR